MSEGPVFTNSRGVEHRVAIGQWRCRNLRSVTVLAKIDTTVDHRRTLGWTWSARLCWFGLCLSPNDLPMLLTWDENGINGGTSDWDLKEPV